jgi:hypothetical protein
MNNNGNWERRLRMYLFMTGVDLLDGNKWDQPFLYIRCDYYECQDADSNIPIPA